MHHFYPLDITHKIEGGRPVIYLFGRLANGEQIMVSYDQFAPYFYVDSQGSRDRISKLTTTEKDVHYTVTAVTQVTKKILGKPTDVLKVEVNLPLGVPLIKSIVRDQKLGDCYEYDISYTRRFLIDFGITLFTSIKFEGEHVSDVNRVPLYRADTIESSDGQTYSAPKILAIDIETYFTRGKFSDMKTQPIIMIGLYAENYRKVITWKPVDKAEDYVESVASEADMLTRCKEILEELSPDILVGYNSDFFDLTYIQWRAKKYKIKYDVGLDFSELQILGRKNKKAKITGIVHLDLFQFVRRVMRTSLETDSLKLDNVAQELLGERKLDVDISSMGEDWDAGKNLSQYCQYNLHDAKITYDLALKILPNVIELVKIVGVSFYDVSRFPFSQQVEWYLINQAYMQNELSPNKPGYREQQQRARQQVKGGFVLEPKPGLYTDLVVFDYRSLYPSIMASHNISPGTLRCECCQGETIETEVGPVWFCTKIRGFISRVIEDLITRRARIKEMLKKHPTDPLLYARSIALKLLANSMYGYLGFEFARWYNYAAQGATTAYGRKYVQDVMAKAKEEGFEVVYGDTDSAMLLRGDKTKEDAIHFMERVNQNLPGLMELEIEGFYPRSIFVAAKGAESGAKKKYAMIDESGGIKIVGFETVRRNWSFIAKEVQKKVIDLILREGAVKEAITYAKETIDSLRNHEIPVNKVLIHTQLQKNISEYTSIGPHVAAAKRMVDKGVPVAPGTIIKYVVVKGKGLIREKVRLPEEITPEDYDADYYIEHQIIPSVERIFLALGYETKELLMEGKQSSLSDF
jgi:DNA polymerase I